MPAGLLLTIAIGAEVVATLALSLADGLSRPWVLAAAVAGYLVSFGALALVLRELDVGLVYAVWAGAGTAAVAIIGVAAFGEPIDALKALSILAVIAGVVGLNLSGAH